MTLPAFDRTQMVRLAELIAVVVLDHYFTTWVEAAFGLFGIVLPAMPLFQRTYLFFIFILLVCLWIRLRGEKFSDFGLIVPARWLRFLGLGLVVFIAAMAYDMLARPFLDAFVASVTHTSPTLAEQHFAPLKGNGPLLALSISAGWLVGGFGEEMLFRGFIMTRIAQVLGGSRAAWVLALLLQAIPFAIGHAYQGPVGVVGIYFGALITGAGTLIWGRNLWPSIVAHGLQDTVAFIAFYYGLIHA
jgi:hypothetical protein